MSQGQQAPNAWRVLFVLFLANFLNMYDRTMPGIINEPIRLEFGLQDLQLGLLSTAFTVVYGICGLPLGRLADTRSRKMIIGCGLIVWSMFTALSGFARSFYSYLFMRIGVGVGEASCGPAAMAMIGDLFPANRRGRAIGLYWLGLPFGIILASFSVGLVVRLFGTWRGAFYVAGFPGILLAVVMFLTREPVRGAAETASVPATSIDRPIRRLLRIPTFLWLTLAGVTVNFSTQSAGAFVVPLMQRYYGLPLGESAVDGGIILGFTGLVGFPVGGWIADKVYTRSERGRLMFGAVSLAAAAGLTVCALALGRESTALTFVAVFSLGWILQYQFFTTAFAAFQDICEPRLRAMAVSTSYVFIYVLGGSLGPMIVGGLSDHFAGVAMAATGATSITPEVRGLALHDAIYLIPVVLTLTAASLLFASFTFRRDAEAMRLTMAAGDPQTRASSPNPKVQSFAAE